MACWKWFEKFLKEAGVKVTYKNREKIDEIIHQYIGAQSSYDHCSKEWSKAKKEIQSNKKLRELMIERLKTIK